MNDTTTSKVAAWNAKEEGDQYSLTKILGIWAAVTIPMGILAWVVFPALSPDYETDPIGTGYVRMGALTVGLIWLFVLSLIIVYREEGDLRWATIKRRLWLNTPRDPKTGETRRKLWLWLVPIVLLHTVAALLLLPMVDDWVSTLLPFIAPPPGFELGEFLQSPEAGPLFLGNWGILGMFLVMITFNILGEEFLWRGVLLPKMNGVFGKWDWVANGVLGTLYHVSMPWSWLGTTGVNWIFFYALPAKYFRSTWFSVITHGSIMVLQTLLILGLVLGLMSFQENKLKITILNGNPDASNASFDDYLARRFTQLEQRLGGNGYWDEWLKENEAYEKSFARPYGE